jgi:ADP-heptose:LPS heptosyltransferase
MVQARVTGVNAGIAHCSYALQNQMIALLAPMQRDIVKR